MTGVRATALRTVSLMALLYVFLLSIALMDAAFSRVGGGLTRALLNTTANPVIGLMAGLLATALIQSSSTTTSIVVGLVAAGALTLRGAVPMIIGANMGTTVTNTIVAMTALRRREEFRRSFAGATVHDLFNILSVLVILPIEIALHPLERAATALADRLVGTGGVEFHSPIKAATKPVARQIVEIVEVTGWNDRSVGLLVLLVALVGIVFALSRLVGLLRGLFLARAEGAFAGLLRRGGPLGILLGVFMTVLVQSSSVTTSLLVPLVGAGIVSLEAAFTVTLGANVGTTVTALLASTAGTHDAVAIALVHLLFNMAGLAIFYPVPAIRRIPVRLARKLADLAMGSKVVPIAYLLSVFFLMPGIFILVHRALSGG